MGRFSTSPSHGGTAVLLGGGLLCVMVATGCVTGGQHKGASPQNSYLTSDTRHSIRLSVEARNEHRAAILQHLQTVQAIVNAFVDEDFEAAQSLTSSHLSFFVHRQIMAQQDPANFPPTYLAMATAHREAAQKLARVIPSKDLKRILPSFNNFLKACVACHLEYQIG